MEWCIQFLIAYKINIIPLNTIKYYLNFLDSSFYDSVAKILMCSSKVPIFRFNQHLLNLSVKCFLIIIGVFFFTNWKMQTIPTLLRQ